MRRRVVDNRSEGAKHVGWSRRDQVDFASLCLAPFVHKAAKSARDWAGRLRQTPALNRRQYKPQNWPFGPPDPPSENKNQIYRLHSGHSDGPIIHEHCACAQATAGVRRFILCGLICACLRASAVILRPASYKSLWGRGRVC
jgi:hypothetical protein